MQYINQKELETMTNGDSELVADLAIMFVRQLPQHEARIRIGIESGNIEEIRTIAHQLKSCVSYFGASHLREQASELELATEKGDMEDVKSLCASFLDGIEKLIDELRLLTKLALEKDND